MMRFYRVDWKDYEPTSQTRDWFTSKLEAEKCARESAYGDYDARVTEVEVPTDKAGLLAFLRKELWQNPYADAGL